MITIEVSKYNVDVYDTDFERNGYKYYAIRITEFNGNDKKIGNNLVYVIDFPNNDTIEKIKRYCVDIDNIDYLMLLPKNTTIKLVDRIYAKIVY